MSWRLYESCWDLPQGLQLLLFIDKKPGCAGQVPQLSMHVQLLSKCIASAQKVSEKGQT